MATVTESGKMYPLMSYSFLQVLLVFTCEVQTSKAAESQINILKESFQKALINDSKQLLILQKVFLTPRPKYHAGLYLVVSVAVTGTIVDYNNTLSDLIHNLCSFNPQFGFPSESCTYYTSMTFEILPPDQDTSIVQTFLNKDEIRMILEVLDLLFYSLAKVFQQLQYSDDNRNTNYELELMADKVEITLKGLQADVHEASYLTLSWVSQV